MDMARRTLISFDWALKNILRNKENFDILEGFLQELTGEELTILELLESESNQKTEDQKFNRVDLLAKDNKDQRILIELQYIKQMDYFQRILFGASKLITDNTTSGDEYGTIKKIITIHIVYFDLGQGTDYIYKGETIFEGIHDKSILELNAVQKEMFNATKVSEIFPQHYVIRIDNFKDEVATTLDEWIYFFKNSAVEDTFKAKGINLANEKLSLLKLNEKDRKQYDFYMEDVSFNK